MNNGQTRVSDKRFAEWAERYGTPLYVYDAEIVRARAAALRSALHPAVRLFYSMKANPNPTIVRLLYDLGLHLEICSPGEWEAAKAAGASAERVMMLGPGKSRAELKRALSHAVRYLVAESVQELALIADMAKSEGRIAEVGIRINPRQSAPGARLKMGGAARQFGIDEDQLPEAMRLTEGLRHVRICGIHGYFGTRILQAETIAANFSHMLNLAERLMESGSAELRFVGLGGGFGIPYYDGEAPLDLEALSRLTHPLFETFVRKYPSVQLLAESGRYLVAESGTYLTRVRYTKRSQGVDFAVADGGIHHHAAAGGSGSLLKRHFPIRIIGGGNREGEKRPYRIAGPLCTPEDLLASQAELAELHPGDLLGIANSGAYGLTFSPVLFLSHTLPRELLTDEGGAKIALIRDGDEISRRPIPVRPIS